MLHMLTSLAAINGDTPLGIKLVGGNEMVLTVIFLFGLMHELQAKVDVLTKYSKNTGVIFQQIAFSSKAECLYWYTPLNSAGLGLAAFVDLVSIWAFASGDHVDTSQWLNKLHWMKSVELKGGNADAVYTHSMSWRYPASFVGKDKNLILSTMTIKILELYDAWRGTIMGDNQKECLMSDLQMAVHHHCQYCDNFACKDIL